MPTVFTLFTIVIFKYTKRKRTNTFTQVFFFTFIRKKIVSLFRFLENDVKVKVYCHNRKKRIAHIKMLSIFDSKKL